MLSVGEVHRYSKFALTINYNRLVMKNCLLFFINLAIGAALFALFYDASAEYTPITTIKECLSTQNGGSTFCAQCVWRLMLPQSEGKALKVNAGKSTAILKIRNEQNLLNCKEYLQLPDSSDSNLKKTNPILLDESKSIGLLVAQLDGELSHPQEGKNMVFPQYRQLIIYEWDALNGTTTVQVPNKNAKQNFKSIFVYLLNTVIVFFIILVIFNKTIFSHLRKKMLFTIGLHAIALQIILADYEGSINFWSYSRVLLLSAFIQRVQTNIFLTVIITVIGALTTVKASLFLIYLVGVILYSLFRGISNENTKQIWVYIILTLFIYLVHYLRWFFELSQLADASCLFIEFTIQVLSPIGLLLIKDAKYIGFDIYKPKIREGISLNGFQEEEEEEGS